MKHQLVIARLIFGLTFIMSGFVKLIDPVGTGLVIQEYLNVINLHSLSFLAVPSGILLSLLEFVVGVAMFMRMRMKEMSVIALVMTVFFTIVTLLLLIFNPIEDCGCFGEAASMTHGESFFKNILLLLCIIPIYLKRKTFRVDPSTFSEWMFLSIYGAMALLFSIISYVRMPVIEFGDFRPGKDIAVHLMEGEKGGEFETLFVYEKDGEQREFFIDEIPDTTWTYVETIDIKGDVDAPFDFYITNSEGEHITDSLIVSPSPIFICSIYDLEKFYTPERWSQVELAKAQVEERGAKFWLLVSASEDQIREILGEEVPDNFRIGYADYKTVIAAQRSNGGYIYMSDAYVVKKWSRQGFSRRADLDVISDDSDITMIKDIIKQQLIYEISIVVLFLSIALIRYFCRRVASKL